MPPTASGAFVCAMEDVLEVYTRPYDPAYPQVCMDELSKQLVGETRLPVPPAPGQVARIDYEYERLGVANLFIFFEPLAGGRHLEVTAHRTKQANRRGSDRDETNSRARPGRHSGGSPSRG